MALANIGIWKIWPESIVCIMWKKEKKICKFHKEIGILLSGIKFWSNYLVGCTQWNSNTKITTFNPSYSQIMARGNIHLEDKYCPTNNF